MLTYEILFVNRAEASQEKIKETAEKIQSVILRNNGEVFLSENWGKRRLAFKIKGCTDGNYYRMIFSADPLFVKELDRDVRVNEDVIRHIIVRAQKVAEKPPVKEKEEPSITQVDTPQAVEPEVEKVKTTDKAEETIG
jgi:small subunit ribosomal protein S6